MRFFKNFSSKRLRKIFSFFNSGKNFQSRFFEMKFGAEGSIGRSVSGTLSKRQIVSAFSVFQRSKVDFIIGSDMEERLKGKLAIGGGGGGRGKWAERRR